jgi:hypothetical protein
MESSTYETNPVPGIGPTDGLLTWPNVLSLPSGIAFTTRRLVRRHHGGRFEWLFRGLSPSMRSMTRIT